MSPHTIARRGTACARLEHGARLIAVALALPLLFGAGCREREGPASNVPAPTPVRAPQAVSAVRDSVRIGGETFALEVASTSDARVRGLMYRREIAPDGGMVFVFPYSIPQSFWMGNCLVDIDILFLDPQGRVTAVHRMKTEEPQRPGETELDYQERLPRYTSRLPAQFAIELRAGSLDRLAVAVGDTIHLDLARLKGLAR